MPYVEHVPPDANAGMRWLTNQRPDRWRDKVSAEVTGKDGAPLVPEPSSRDLARAVIDILREARIGTEFDEPPNEIDDDEVQDLVSAAPPFGGHTDPRIADALRTGGKINDLNGEPSLSTASHAVEAGPAGVHASTATRQADVETAQTEPAAKPVRKVGLAPNESECFDNGAVIVMDPERGKYAVIAADGMLCGYRIDYAVAKAFAQSLPAKN